MPLPRSQFRGRGRGGRPSIQDRVGTLVTAAVRGNTIGVSRPRSSLSVHSRLGLRGGGGVRGRVVGPAGLVTSPKFTDARQKINLNRVKSGRIADAREKIDNRRVSQRVISPLPSSAGFLSTRNSFPPIKSLKITTSNSPPRSSGGGGGIFRSAVSGMGGSDWEYSSPARNSGSYQSPPAMLTRTISNPLARGYPPPPPPDFSSYSRPMGGSFYSSRPSEYMTGPDYHISTSRDGGRFRSDMRDDAMDVDSPHTTIRSSIQARLDIPKYRVKVSNLKSSVSLEDLTELFGDVGDLITVKSAGLGQADIFYRTKGDCVKAIDAYHNRLLDGSPMRVVYVDDRPESSAGRSSGGGLTALKSASGSSITLPKSTAAPIKVCPDLSAIHKVLFQPTSSSNAAKMLFKGASE